MQELIDGMPNAHFHIHVSSECGRLDPRDELGSFLGQHEARREGRVWVYVSGPEGLLASAETACVEQQRVLRSGKDRRTDVITELDWHVARYSV